MPLGASSVLTSFLGAIVTLVVCGWVLCVFGLLGVKELSSFAVAEV